MTYYKCGSIHPTQNSNVVVDTASGAVANFQTPLAMPLKSLKVDVNAVQEAGTPTPETSLPISGRSEISVVHCGKNLFNLDYLTASGITIQSGEASATARAFHAAFNQNGIPHLKFKENTRYTLSFEAYTGGEQSVIDNNGLYLNFVYTDNTTSSLPIRNNITSYSHFSATSLSGKTVQKIIITFGNIPLNVWHLKDIQVEESAEATSFEPFNGNAEVINLGGTYYGGHFTQDKAGHRQFEVTHKVFVFTGSESWQTSTTFFYLPAGTLDDIPIQSPSICSNGMSVTPMTNRQIRIYPSSGINSQYISMSSTVSELQGYLSNGIKFLYELATPILIDLPDGEPIITFNGTNNIYADTGDTSLQFRKIG